MAEITIEQALFRREGLENPRLFARSTGFREEWTAEAEWLILGFGDPPAGTSCPAAVYAHPLGKQHVAVVQVAARQADDANHKITIDYHLLVVPRTAYTRFLGDPFAMARLLPPPWQEHDPLPTRTLPARPLPARTVQEVQQILKRTKAAALSEDMDPTSEAYQEYTMLNAQSPALLGGVQVLVDGGRVVFERPGPDQDLIEGLWTLLPTSTRCHLWPASFAFGNVLGFDAVVTPRARREEFPDYTGEDQAADYPEGRYERRLQTAVEAGDQRELDALFARRSVTETVRLGLAILAIVSVLVLALKVIDLRRGPNTPSPEQTRQRAAVAASLVGSPTPWHTVGLLPIAQKTWNAISHGDQ